MKSLVEFVKELEYDELDKLVLNHCYIHYDFNYRKSSEHTIYESDGAFPEEHSMVSKILKEVNDNYKKNYNN